nr:hypothetical protein [uncultured Allomuricauda sp.]
MKLESYYRADFEEEFNTLHERTINECKEKGQEDGRRNTPVIETNFQTPFEKGIISKYQSYVEAISSKGGQFLQEVYDKEVFPIEQELEMLNKNPDYIKSKIEEERRELERKLQQANENHQDDLKVIENEPSWIESKNKFSEAKQRFKEVTEKINRQELHISMPKWLYLVIIFSIGISELPINYQVFVSFRETPLLTLIMSCILVISLPLLAHFAGKFLRQFKENRTYVWLLVLILFGITAISYYTAVLRKMYLSKKAGPTLEELNNDFWTFFTISLIIFLVGGLASYLAHDPSIEFTHVNKAFNVEKKKYATKSSEKYEIEKKERQRYNIEIKQYQVEFAESRKRIENLLENLRSQLAESKTKHDKALEYFIGFEQRVNASCKEAINKYRDTNLTYRNNHKQPRYWENDIQDLELRIKSYRELSPNPKSNG